MNDGFGWVILLIAALAFFWIAGERSEKDQRKIGELTYLLCVAEGESKLACAVQCVDLKGMQQVGCKNARPNSTK